MCIALRRANEKFGNEWGFDYVGRESSVCNLDLFHSAPFPSTVVVVVIVEQLVSLTDSQVYQGGESIKPHDLISNSADHLVRRLVVQFASSSLLAPVELLLVGGPLHEHIVACAREVQEMQLRVSLLGIPNGWIDLHILQAIHHRQGLETLHGGLPGPIQGWGRGMHANVHVLQIWHGLCEIDDEVPQGLELALFWGVCAVHEEVQS